MIQESTPFVSVVIATRDRSEVLEQCLQRVVEQDYPHYEIIIVDNSADDLTAAVVDKFPVMVYVRESSHTDNLSYLRNVGVHHSRGELVALIDDDSLVQPGWMSAAVAAFADPFVGGITGRVIEDAAPVNSAPIVATLSPRDDMTCNFNNLWPFPVPVDYLYGCNMVWSRKALERVGGFDPWMGYSRQDQEISLRVARAGYKLNFHPDVVVHHLRAPRTAKAVQRSGAKDLRSRFIHCRSLTYQYARPFGISFGLLKLTLWTLPKGDLWALRVSPSLRLAVKPFVTLTGVLWGLSMAGVAAVGLHHVPSITPVGDSTAKMRTITKVWQ